MGGWEGGREREGREGDNTKMCHRQTSWNSGALCARGFRGNPGPQAQTKQKRRRKEEDEERGWKAPAKSSTDKPKLHEGDVAAELCPLQTSGERLLFSILAQSIAEPFFKSPKAALDTEVVSLKAQACNDVRALTIPSRC